MAWNHFVAVQYCFKCKTYGNRHRKKLHSNYSGDQYPKLNIICYNGNEHQSQSIKADPCQICETINRRLISKYHGQDGSIFEMVIQSEVINLFTRDKIAI